MCVNSERRKTMDDNGTLHVGDQVYNCYHDAAQGTVVRICPTPWGVEIVVAVEDTGDVVDLYEHWQKTEEV